MIYAYFLAANALEMLYEAWISARNSRALLKRGAVEIAPRLLPIMASIYLLMYAGSAFEFQGRGSGVSWIWAVSFFSLYLLAKALKFWAISSLGQFWTMRVLIVPQTNVVTHGPYRWIRHPNYVAVMLELAATPLIGKCLVTFGVTMVLFTVVLIFRIRYEEDALRRYTDYSQKMD